MYNTEATSDWNNLQTMKLVLEDWGTLSKERLEALKKKIEKTQKREDIDTKQENNENENFEDDVSRFEDQKVTKKPFKQMKDIIKESARKNFQNENPKLSIRPEFDNLRQKIREEVSEKINLSAKLLQKTAEDQIMSTFAKSHAKIKKVRADHQRVDAPKDSVFWHDEKMDAKKDFEIEDDEYIDFKKLNQDKVDRLVKEHLNRKFPNEIENILKLEEKKYVLLANEKDQNYKKNQLHDIHAQLEKKPYHQEDVIEAYSVVYDKSSKLKPVPFYRELGPYAREVINIKNESKPKNNRLALDLLDEKEFYIDDKNITFENIVNIVAGRISAKRLKKILNRRDYTECSDDEGGKVEDIGDSVPLSAKNLEELNKNREKEKMSNFQKIHEDVGYINSPYSQHHFLGKEKSYPNNRYDQPDRFDHQDKQMQEFQEEKRYYNQYDQRQDFEPIDNFSDRNQSPQQNMGKAFPLITSKELRDVEDYAQQFPTPKDEEVKVDRETQTTKPNIQFSTETEDSAKRSSEDMDVNSILKEIESLKEAKSNSDKLPKLPGLRELRQQLYNKIEDRLAQLLYLIADDPERKNNLKDNLSTLIKDIHLLEGKVLDGHLKKNLLFQFLKEYKKLLEEKEGEQSKETLSNSFRSFVF